MQDTTFDKSGSPYILNDYIKIYPGVRLNIDSGVSIRAGTSTEEDFYPSISLANSVLDIRGSKSDRVSLENVGIYSDSSNISINNADLKQSGLFINRSKANIFNSSISKNTTALYTRLSEISIDSSVFTDNTTAIDIGPDKIFQAINKSKIKNGFKYGLGGEGNANLEFLNSIPTTSVTISNSIFENNSDWAVHNLNESYFDLRNNWWGQNTGPVYVGSNKIVGNNNVEPWLNMRPELPLKPDSLCCSSILFIPGIESSRLYSTSTSKRLWEPLSNKDVERLYLDARGLSIDKTIYSKDVIDNFLGIYGIYKDFIRSMSSFVKTEKINDFSIYPYDWRRNISDIVDSGEKRATSTINLKDLVYDLASRSKTGKVTIVAHSNGGLIAKELIRQLEALGKTDIIDKIISIAVPYLGTPKAVLSLLHGYDQSILSGFIMSESNARGLAQNMFSAYNLLPSPAYFRNLLAPVISFASSTIEFGRESYGPEHAQRVFCETCRGITNGSDGAARYVPHSVVPVYKCFGRGVVGDGIHCKITALQVFVECSCPPDFVWVARVRIGAFSAVRCDLDDFQTGVLCFSHDADGAVRILIECFRK
jgi:pimeloyl-ACP methyl ester carboxylesterase